MDRTWAVIGGTNVDNRSFKHTDEVNVAVRDVTVPARLLGDFEVDLKASNELTSSEWASRPVVEKLVEPACWILERQQ